MEPIVYDDSPLAQALLEGEGQGESESAKSLLGSGGEDGQQAQQFAPIGIRPNVRGSLTQALRISVPGPGPIAQIRNLFSQVLHSRLNGAENAKFLEHFRYTIVASQLFSDQIGHGSVTTTAIATEDGSTSPDEYQFVSTSMTGSIITASLAFALAWLIRWARAGRPDGFSKSRSLIVVGACAAALIGLYAYARRQWLQYLRQYSVKTASAMVTNLQAFESSSTAALTLIQEVELVSRGYRLSTPLPPITRLDDNRQHSRRCVRLRRNLRKAFGENIPPLLKACENLRTLVPEDDLDKYLDVYEINRHDVDEALSGLSSSEFEDMDSLKALRILHFRLGILRRVFLCSLLSLPANGTGSDLVPWRTAVSAMERLAVVAGDWSEKLGNILTEDEQFTASPGTPIQQQQDQQRGSPERERFRTQIRKIGSLSSGIRGLQAKLQILREESNKALEASGDIMDLGPPLMAQYDSIGSDLKSLVQAWEVGRASLAINIDRAERRMSQASSGGLRSPVSLGGLTAVEEGGEAGGTRGGSPSDALRALNGDTSTDDSPGASGSASDEEIFEAIAMPRQRTVLSREEKMVKMQEDRARMASARERREAGMSMIRELETVINLLPNNKASNRRYTSL